MNVSLKILNALSNYISGEMDLHSLRDWQVNFFLNSADLEPDDKEFLSMFEGRYAELSDGLITEQQFRRCLSSAVTVTLSDFTTAQSQARVLVSSTSTSGYFGTSGPGTSRLNMAELLPA